jgi:hypothetical protein
MGLISVIAAEDIIRMDFNSSDAYGRQLVDRAAG